MKKIHVKCHPDLERRCRCGKIFDRDGRTVRPSQNEMEELRADPWLIVTPAQGEAEPQQEPADIEKTQGDTSQADAAQGEAQNTAANAAKKAG